MAYGLENEMEEIRNQIAEKLKEIPLPEGFSLKLSELDWNLADGEDRTAWVESYLTITHKDPE